MGKDADAGQSPVRTWWVLLVWLNPAKCLQLYNLIKVSHVDENEL